MMDALRTFLEQQPLLALFVVIGLGYALGGVNVRGFALGAGAVLFVGLAAGMLSPRAAPPALVGSLGLVLFVYGIGIQFGKQFFTGVASPFGLKANGLVLLSHLTGIGVCYLAYATFSLSPAAVAGLFCGALTSTPALQAAISAVGSNEPALGYSVAYPFGFIAPFFCMYFANLWIKQKDLAPAGTGVDLLEVEVRSPQVIGRPLAEVSAKLPSGVRIVVVRQGNQNRVPAPDIVLAAGDVVALAGESAEALEGARLQSRPTAAETPGQLLRNCHAIALDVGCTASQQPGLQDGLFRGGKRRYRPRAGVCCRAATGRPADCTSNGIFCAHQAPGFGRSEG